MNVAEDQIEGAAHFRRVVVARRDRFPQKLDRVFAGILFLAFYFIALPGIFSKTLLKKFYESMDFMRYSIMVGLFLTMFTLPLKMVLRWTMNLKYFVDTPWIKF